MKIVRKLLSPDEISPANLRYNADCDCIQQTADGGSTWTDVPAADPRSAPGFRVPANTSPDPQCNSAANMVAYLRSLIAIDLVATTNWTLASSLLAVILLVFPGGVLIDLLLIAADVLLTVGASEIETAFTEDVYDGLLCIFYCNIDTDGQMSDAQLTAIYSAVAAQFDGVVQAVFGAHASTLGPVGWSNAGATGEETGDCSGCDCSTEYCVVFENPDQYEITSFYVGFALATHQSSGGDPDDCILSGVGNDGVNAGMALQVDIAVPDAPKSLSRVTLDYKYDYTSIDEVLAQVISVRDATSGDWTDIYVNVDGGTHDVWHHIDQSSAIWDNIDALRVRMNVSGGDEYVGAIRLDNVCLRVL